MIRLEITGETPELFAQALAGAIGAMMSAPSQSATTPAPSATTTPGRGKGKSSPAAAPSSEAQSSAADETSPTGGAAGQDATNGATSGSSTANGTSEITRESVAAKCSKYGSPQKGGPAALKELFLKHGSANGKWSEIADDKLPALNAELDGLLA